MDLSWLTTICLAIITLYLFNWLLRPNHSYWEKYGIRSLSLSLLSQAKDALMPNYSVHDKVIDLYKKMDDEKVAGFFFFTLPMVLIRDPELINQILIKDFPNFEDRSIPMGNPKDLLSLTLITLRGNKWRNARHKLAPTFTSGKLRLMFGKIKDCSDELVSYLKIKNGEDVEGKLLIRKFLLKVIGSITFGLDVNSINDDEEQNNEFVKYTNRFMTPSLKSNLKRALNMVAPKVFRFRAVDSEVDRFFRNLVKDVIKFRETHDTSRNDFLQIMINEKKKVETGFGSELDHSEHVESDDKELIDQLKNIQTDSSSLKKSEFFTEEFIAAQAFGFISAGTDTTSTVVSYMLYELAVNQDVQKRLQKEIQDGLSSREFSYENISKIKYLEQTIYEALRLHPVLPLLGRVCTHDYKIPETNYIVKKGELVHIPVFALHMDPQYFPDPEKFNPDRFEDMTTIPKGVYLPFGGGPRFCIAMRLAMLEMKIVIAAILSHFTVHLSKKQKLPLKIKKFSFFGEVEGGIWFNFINIEK